MRKPLLALLLLTLAITGVAVAWKWSSFGFGGSAELVPEDERRPAGAWSVGTPLDPALAGDPDQLARLLALPYTAGEKLATAPGLGVVVHDPERAQPGVNFYVSGHASEAILIDMEGTFLHRWTADYRDTFPDNPGRTGASRHNLRRAQLLPDGGVLALWHGGGLARLDLRSNVVWAKDLGFYNDLFYSPGGPRSAPTPESAGSITTDEGERERETARPPHHHTSETLIALHKTAENRPRFGKEPVLNDQLLWLDPATGKILRRVSLLDAVIDSEWAPLLTEEHRDPADLLHANTITVLDEDLVEGSPFEPGWILISLREISLIAVVDPEANDGRGAIVWGLHGPFKRQHEPVLLPGGPDSEAQLLVFDNQGISKDKARALRLSLDGEILWSYPDPDGPTADQTLSSDEVGVVQPLANGNLLIVESLGGRAIELGPRENGDWEEVVWKFETPHRTGDQGRFIANLMDLQRIPRPDWLPRP